MDHIYEMIGCVNLLLVVTCTVHIPLTVKGQLTFFTPDPTNGDATSVSENSASGVNVYTVIATGGGGGSLTYTVVSQTPASPVFHLDSSSGVLTTPAGLDAETTSQFDFNFRVSDGTNTVDSSTLTITIANVNDNVPQFVNLPYETSIPDTTANGTGVFTVLATDNDITHSITYSITAGNTPITFALHETTGILTVSTTSADNLNATTMPTYTLTVEASDGTFTNTTTVTVNVINPCLTSPCHNGGSCMAGTTTGSFVCVCANGYKGTTCEISKNVDDCANKNCSGHGICVDGIMNYTCDCFDRYSGKDCQMAVQTTTQVSVAGNSHATKTLEDIIKTACTATEWKISINLAELAVLYPMVNSSNIYLGAKNCTGLLHDNDLVFQKGLHDCQTKEQISDDILRFENELFCASFDPTHPFIIHQFQWTYNVECDVRRQETSSSHVHHVSTSHHGTSNANYNISTRFYMDPNFEHQLPGNPLNVNIGETIYVKVLVSTSDWSIKMRLHTCYTKPSGWSTDLMTYTLINDGCEVDRNTHIISQSAHETTFVYQDFVYASDHEGLDLYCNATICDVTDYSRNCLQVCHASPSLVG